MHYSLVKNASFISPFLMIIININSKHFYMTVYINFLNRYYHINLLSYKWYSMIKQTFSKGINIDKANDSREFLICYYNYFFDINLKFWPYICNVYHNLMQKGTRFNDFAIVYLKRNGYKTHFWNISKDEIVILLKNSDLNKKVHHCNMAKKFFYFFL